MVEESKEDRAKRLGNLRQVKYYKANADRIKKLAQGNRDELQSLRIKCDSPAIPEPIIKEPITVFNQENIVNGLKELTINNYTKTKYIRDITTVFRLTGCTELGTCLKTFKNIKKALEESHQIQNPELKYGVNSKKGLVQSILFVIDTFNIPMKPDIKKMYSNYIDELKKASSNLTKMKQSNPEYSVMLFPEYLDKIKEKFGENSKEYLIAKLYSEVPARDNFGDLEIVPTLRKNDNSIQNYLILPRSKTAPLKVVIQTYKTIGKYGIQNIKLSPELSTLIREYIITNGLTDKLFPRNSKGLTAFITSMNKKIGVESGINTIRKIFASTALNNKDITPKERLELSTAMMHSPLMSLNYERLIK